MTSTKQAISQPLVAKKMGLTNDSSSRQSFDRFGDDLSELMLSYLTFEDKLRHESVSKQWHQLIPQTVTDIRFDEKFLQITDNSLTALLSKCPNITSIDISLLDFTKDYTYSFSSINRYLSILSLIIRYCPQLRHIYIDRNVGTNNLVSLYDIIDELVPLFHRLNQLIPEYDRLFTVFAEQLQTIQVKDQVFKLLNKVLIKHLKKCTNLSTFSDSVPEIYRQLTIEPLFKRLKKLEINVLNKKMVNIFQDIVRLYGKQLTVLYVEIILDEISDHFKTIMTGLSQMSQLFDLNIKLNDIDNTDWTQLSQLLPPIGHNCYRLKRLTICLETNEIDDEIGSNLLKSIFDNFKQLKRLFLIEKSRNGIDLIGSDDNHQMMNGFKQLTHLSIISKKMSTTDHHFISNIVANCPRLQYLEYTGYCIDSNGLQSLSQLPHLRTIILNNVCNADLNAIQNCRKICKVFISGENNKLL
ncbi:uncharacterized protein LOC128957734 [Oppia nitens]|uniref:uncharacterized protein LOC128957734 n=1 Tax=Oppia nitens TaxID=1686743 RepID=UPI0023DCCE08|nr:uncharacterized protein LOC128957734 [Oppia nitens]